jgi:hypothetical protein
LVTQDDASVGGRYDLDERTTLNATVHGARISDPLHQLHLGNRRYYNFDLGLTHSLTEHWNLTASAAYYRQQLNAQSSSSVILGLSLSRQFGRVRL